MTVNERQAANVIRLAASRVEEIVRGRFQEIDVTAEINQSRVLESFRKHRVSEAHFYPSTGYGYDDEGREVLEKIYADVFATEDAIVRPQIVSGTHAIATVLFALLSPGDGLLYITGKPYDTLLKVIGSNDQKSGTLLDLGINFQTTPLHDDGTINKKEVTRLLKENVKVVAIQRSRGYAERPALTVEDIAEMISFIRRQNKDVIIFVDNCYGEFVETKEPTHVGANIMAGSLIKNPGGGLAKTGGYIVGRGDLIARCADRLTAPGIGKETGAMLYSLLDMYQGFFLAPHVVSQALKGAVFTAALLEELGFHTAPRWRERRGDIVQTVRFQSKEELLAFCRQIQAYSPVNSFVQPMPAALPGYADPVIMAAGTFVQGASSEFSADAPIRPPYTAYVQGGLTYEHVKIAIQHAVRAVLQNSL